MVMISYLKGSLEIDQIEMKLSQFIDIIFDIYYIAIPGLIA